MAGASDTTSARLSTYCRQKGMPQADKGDTCANTSPNYEAKPHHQICGGCGRHLHGTPGTGSHQLKCPAWGQACSNCGRPNHLSKVCRAKKVAQVVKKDPEANEAAMDTLIAHIIFYQMTGTYTAKDTSQIMEIEAYVVPFLPKPDPRQTRDIPRNRSTKIAIFLDSGATICFRGLKHLLNMGLSTNNLIPSRKVVQAVRGITLMCQGWLPMEFNVQGKTTKQALYICKKIQRLYFSKAACIDIGILPKDFPNPVATMSPQPDMAMQYLPSASIRQELDTSSKHNKVKNQLPMHPKKLPFLPAEQNIPRLKEWLLQHFANTSFRKNREFPPMSGPAAHIHLKEGTVPKARHNPIPVAFHFKEPVRQALWEDVKRGIITPVPVGMPTDWCSTMVITAKKNGKPRRTIDYQHLNSQCKQETHHTGSPFQLALQVPPNQRKKVLDAVDRYHSVPLDMESQPLTTFIMEWGRFMYLRMPQGYLASGDAYTQRYDEVIKDVTRKVKIMDDTLLYDSNTEGAFFHTFDFLLHCAKNGIVLTREKFRFCLDTVQFRGL